MAKKRIKLMITLTLSPGVVKDLDLRASQAKVSRSQLADRLLGEKLHEERAAFDMMGNPVMRDFLFEVMGRPEVLAAMAAAAGERMNDQQMKLFTSGAAALANKGKSKAKGG